MGQNKYFIRKENVETQVFPWGVLNWLSEPRVTGTKNMASGLVEVEPGQGHARHNHEGCEEVLFILQGKALQKIELPESTIEKEVSEGELIFVPADVYHSTLNTGDGNLRFLAVYQYSGPEVDLRAAPDCKVLAPES